MSKPAIIFLLMLLVGLFAALASSPSYGIFLYVIEYFLFPKGRWWGQGLPHLRYSFLIALTTLVSCVFRNRRFSQNKIFDVPQTKWLVLLGLVMVLTWPIAIDSVSHERFMLLYAKYLLLYCLIFKVIDTPKKFEQLIGVFLLGQFYFGLVAFSTGRTGNGRLEGIGSADSRDANETAAILVVAVPLLVNYLVTGKKWQKICSLVILVFTLNALVLLNSRGAFLSMLLSMSYYIYKFSVSSFFLKSDKLKIILGALGGAVAFLYLADSVFWERMGSLSDPSMEGSGSRMALWLTTFDMVGDHPFGLGAWGFQALSPTYLPSEMLSHTGKRAVHSMYFEVFVEYGYHGFFIFSAFLYSNFSYLKHTKKLIKERRDSGSYYGRAIALEASFMAFLTAGVFISVLYMEILYWMAAFIASYGNSYRKISVSDRRRRQGVTKDTPA